MNNTGNCETCSKHKILFFPYAGGSGEAYCPWFPYLSATVEGAGAKLPGRGSLLGEEAIDNCSLMIDHVLSQVINGDKRPLSLFGHSMGALIAFELAHKLVNDYGVIPAVLFLSGHRAPSLPNLRQCLHKLAPDKLFESLTEMGGVPETQGISLDLLEPFLPALYKDFKLCETYEYCQHHPLPCKLVILWGEEDPYIQKEKMTLWENETIYPVDYHSFEGGHFYIHKHYQAIASVINETLDKKEWLVNAK